MIRRLILATALAAGGLALANVAQPAAAASQISVWKASGMQQTNSSYWEPTLNQPADYSSPTNYADGRAYIKLQIVSKPSDLFVKPSICFWRHTEVKKFHYETCARSKPLGFTDEGTYYFDLGAPNNFWQKNGVFDWSVPPTLGRIMIKKGESATTQLLMDHRCGQACYKGDDLYDHIPIKMNSELIFVAKGKTLTPPSDWRAACPTSWSSLCRGGATPPPITTPPTTQPPTTTPPTTTPPTTTPPTTAPPTTQPPTTAPPTTPAPYEPPVITVSAGNESLQVAHRIPGANKYQMRYRPEGGKRVWTDVTTATEQTIDGLDNGVRHDIEVRGLVKGSWKSWLPASGTPVADAAPSTTAPSGSPSTPVTGEVSVSANSKFAGLSLDPGTRRIDADWSHPKATRYQLNYRADGASSWTRDGTTTATSQSITGLTNGQQYVVRVRALIGGSWSKWTVLSTTAGS